MVSPSGFGQRLRQAKKLRGCTQERLANESGITATVISHFKPGTRQRASAANLVKPATAVSVPVDFLRNRKNPLEREAGLASGWRAPGSKTRLRSGRWTRTPSRWEAKGSVDVVGDPGHGTSC